MEGTFPYNVLFDKSIVKCKCFPRWGTSMYDVQRFLWPILYLVRRFLPYNVRCLGSFWAAFLNPLIYSKIACHLCTFPCKKISLAQWDDKRFEVSFKFLGYNSLTIYLVSLIFGQNNLSGEDTNSKANSKIHSSHCSRIETNIWGSNPSQKSKTASLQKTIKSIFFGCKMQKCTCAKVDAKLALEYTFPDFYVMMQW